MRLRAAKWLAMSLISVSAFAFASASTEAEACCGLWQALFGWCGGCRSRCSTPCGPSMGGCGPSGCSTGSYYGPVVYGRCSPCAPSCSPCGIASAGCATGNCSAGSSSSVMPVAPIPEPNDNWNPKKRTYAPGSGDAPDSELGESGRPDSSNRASQLNQDDDQTYKKARTSEETDANDGQGNSSPASKKTDSSSSKNGKKSPAAPKASDADDQDSTRAPTISVDEKVAWRTAPARARMETRPRTVSARIVRLPAYPKSDWLPVEGESKVAKN